MALFTRLTERSYHRPVLVMCMEGWIDAGLGAGAAMASVLAGRSTRHRKHPVPYAGQQGAELVVPRRIVLCGGGAHVRMGCDRAGDEQKHGETWNEGEG